VDIILVLSESPSRSHDVSIISALSERPIGSINAIYFLHYLTHIIIRIIDSARIHDAPLSMCPLRLPNERALNETARAPCVGKSDLIQTIGYKVPQVPPASTSSVHSHNITVLQSISAA
jgi:hypothetical protein